MNVKHKKNYWFKELSSILIVNLNNYIYNNDNALFPKQILEITDKLN